MPVTFALTSHCLPCLQLAVVQQVDCALLVDSKLPFHLLFSKKFPSSTHKFAMPSVIWLNS